MKKIIGILILLGVFSVLFWMTYDTLGVEAIGVWIFAIVVTFLFVIGVCFLVD